MAGLRLLSRWAERSGREYLPLLVPAGSSGPASSGQRRHRKEAQLIAAAEKSQLPLKFEFETDLLSHATEFASRFRENTCFQDELIIHYVCGGNRQNRLTIAI